MSRKIIIRIALVALASAAALPSLAQQASSESLQSRLSSLLGGAREEQLLEPDQAFKFRIAATAAGKLNAELIPAPGYYLYRDKLRFSLRDATGVTIGKVKLPAGEMKNDQTFGKTEVYKKTVPVELALEGKPQGGKLTVVASYQGCNEKMGVCYPPIEKTVKLDLP